MRPPSASYSDSVRRVYSDGALNYTDAYIGYYGVRPASVEFTATK